MLVMLSHIGADDKRLILSCDQDGKDTGTFIEHIVEVLSNPPGSIGSLKDKTVYVPHQMESIYLMAVVLAVVHSGGTLAVFDHDEKKYVTSAEIKSLIPY